MELVPWAELVPQCSTSRNRMYSLGFGLDLVIIAGADPEIFEGGCGWDKTANF